MRLPASSEGCCSTSRRSSPSASPRSCSRSSATGPAASARRRVATAACRARSAILAATVFVALGSLHLPLHARCGHPRRARARRATLLPGLGLNLIVGVPVSPSAASCCGRTSGPGRCSSLASRGASDRFLPPSRHVEEPFRLTPQIARRVAVLGVLALACLRHPLLPPLGAAGAFRRPLPAGRAGQPAAHAPARGAARLDRGPQRPHARHERPRHGRPDPDSSTCRSRGATAWCSALSTVLHVPRRPHDSGDRGPEERPADADHGQDGGARGPDRVPLRAPRRVPRRVDRADLPAQLRAPGARSRRSSATSARSRRRSSRPPARRGLPGRRQDRQERGRVRLRQVPARAARRRAAAGGLARRAAERARGSRRSRVPATRCG